jgi:hypothetical protein
MESRASMAFHRNGVGLPRRLLDTTHLHIPNASL